MDLFITNTTPEEFGQLMSYAQMVTSGDPEKMKQALEILDSQRRNIALALGEDVSGVDFLSNHADLKAEVDAMNISEEHAKQIAKGREQNIANQNRQTQQQTQQHEEQSQITEFTQQKNTAVQGVNELVSKWSQGDIDWSAKEKFLLDNVAQIRDSYPPHLWVSALQTTYDALSSQQAVKPTVTTSPLSPTGRGGGNKVPKSSLEALEQEEGFMG